MILEFYARGADLRRALHNALTFSSRKNLGGGVLLLRLTWGVDAVGHRDTGCVDVYGFDDVVAVRDRVEVSFSDSWDQEAARDFFTSSGSEHQREVFISVADLGARNGIMGHDADWWEDKTSHVVVDCYEKRVEISIDMNDAGSFRYDFQEPPNGAPWSLVQDLLEPGREWEEGVGAVSLSPTRIGKLNRLEPKGRPVVMLPVAYKHGEPLMVVWTYGGTVTGLFEPIEGDSVAELMRMEQDYDPSCNAATEMWKVY